MSSAAWDNDDKRQGSQQDDRWEGWETVPSKKDNTKRGKHSNMMEAPVAGELPDLEKVNCEGNIHGGKASGRSKKDSKNSNKRVDKQSNSSFELDASDLSIMVLSDEEALEKLPGLLNEFILSKCESNDNCRKTDFDGTAREALQRISFLQALQAIEHFAGSVSARIQKRPAYLMGILRGQEQHWDKSRAAANLPGGSGELLALAPTVLVAIAEICMRGNCLPSDFTPEVCLSLHRLTPVLACKAVLAFNSNKRIVAGTRGGVLNRPRFFQRLIQNVAEQNLLALQSGAEASSSPDGSTTVSAASTPTNSSAGSTSTRSLPSPRGSGRKSSGMKMSSRTTSESNTPPMTPERKSKNAQKREESPINVTEKEASNEQVADNASSLDQNAWTSPLANSIGLKPGQKPWDENSSHSQPQQEPGPFDDGRNTSENPGGNLKDAYYFENKRNSPNAEERNTQSGASSQDQSWFGMSTENGNSDDQQPQGGFFSSTIVGATQVTIKDNGY
uniref:Uncharacterized protein n=1 Tax=Mucochytrium quahogii TaxID=96639 RepID=A0A7S2WJT4_9STRA|mmetsp:Transcript_25487/g.55211  ORF Transcript_25487/g.55211 Transcript_25487/m.55211 type:complete len:504 (+) Transcript_25487:190-1701(+)